MTWHCGLADDDYQLAYSRRVVHAQSSRLFLYFFIWIRATLPRLRYDMLMKIGWQGILPIALVNILLLAVGIAVGYGDCAGLPGLSCSASAFTSSPRASRRGLFTANSRRASTIQLFSSAQPYRAVAEHSGSGGQTLPPDAKIGGFPVAKSEREANIIDDALTGHGKANFP